MMQAGYCIPVTSSAHYHHKKEHGISAGSGFKEMSVERRLIKSVAYSDVVVVIREVRPKAVVRLVRA